MVRKSGKKRFVWLKGEKRIWGCAAIVLAAVIGFSMIFHGKGTQNQAAEVSVRFAVAEKGNISKTVTGTGTLENGESEDVLVPVDIRVEKVLADSGDTVTKGQTLATLNEASIAEKLLEIKESLEDTKDEIDSLSDDANDSSTSEYLKAKVLKGRKKELEETEEKLQKLLKSKKITAACDGVISSVNVEEDKVVSETGEGEENSSKAGGDGENLTAVSAGQTDEGISGIVFLNADISENADTKEMGGSNVGNTDTKESAEDNNLDNSGDDASGSGNIKITSCSVEVTPPAAGAKPQTELGAADYFTGTISWSCSTEIFQEETAYTATIKLTAKKGYEFSKNILPEVKGADVTSEVRASDSGESILWIKARFSKTGKAASGQQAADKNQAQDDDNTAGKSGGNGAGNVSGGITAKGVASGSVSAGASGGSTASAESETPEYSVYETPAFSIAAQDETVVSIDVDELDILSVKEGQTAEITVDALEEQSFEGKITKISQAASGNGSTKYPVEITISRTEDMRMGMSVSATISIEEAKDAVLIPVSALQERGGKTFVYTESAEDGALSGEKEVATGLSDGNRAEIVSGLSEGDTVYYLRTGSDDNDRLGSMPGMNGMPGGGMPGGQMPDGAMKPDGKNGARGGSRGGEE